MKKLPFNKDMYKQLMDRKLRPQAPQSGIGMIGQNLRQAFMKRIGK